MQEKKYSIKHWAKDDKPREKLRSKGAQSLSDAELLAILIRDGDTQKNAIELGQELLKMADDNLIKLGKLTIKDYMTVRGIGEAKAVIIAAAMELGRRREGGSFLAKPIVKSSKDVATFCRSLLRDMRQEAFMVLFLSQSNKVYRHEVVSIGGITSTVVDVRIIIKKALEENAVSLIVCHNHPSGSLKPSKADESMTIKIKEAAAFFDIKLLDHLIVSEEGYYSFADEGRI
ncbi:RadC family protein [Pinibacter aurantiacus]|uniref:DNA repair protein RadC n=1 Tax=Pinibacter aurantiacus TaxID=2851599 RepID=A0A9E2W9V6_9BACT|nr:DNA repair protein RadC [Pinibacter aurantiacus]MBV4360676.1 DNA repair protein RadC [Pinibacter aurantiacus]